MLALPSLLLWIQAESYVQNTDLEQTSTILPYIAPSLYSFLLCLECNIDASGANGTITTNLKAPGDILWSTCPVDAESVSFLSGCISSNSCR